MHDTTNWLSAATAARVVLLDAAPDAVRSVLDGTGAVVLECRVARTGSAAHIVEDVLHQLESAATSMFPAWLPGAENLAAGTADVRAVRMLAARLAAASAHFGPYLADLSAAARTGTPVAAYPREIRAQGLSRALSAAYGRTVDAIALHCAGAPPAQLAPAAEWLCDTCRTGVWLLGAPPMERFPLVTAPRTVVPASSPMPRYPPLRGRPHPASTGEQQLERALGACAWATGRTWNETYCGGRLQAPIRVDLMWPDARCIVEIDGDEHRGPAHYAADRARDNRLTLDGYAVLRFTNDQIADDVAAALATIEHLVTSRRERAQR